MNEASRDGTGLARGTPGARRALVALFAAGFATFSSLYSVQALMPLFSQTFGVSPAESSLSLSLTTGVLALTLFVAGLMSEAIDRKRMMAASLLISAGLSIAAAFSPGWHALLAARALEGIALGGVPALAMAYLSEEMRAGDLGFAMGLYIGGSAFGGMSGRVLAGVVADIGGWRASMAMIGGLGLFCAAVFILLLPPSRHFRARRGLALSEHFEPIARHLRHPALPWLFACGFILMGAFVTVYNYIGYRLAAPPFGLSQSAIGAIFVVYLLGIAASALFGRLADRYGRAPVLVAALSVMSLGLLLMLPASLPFIVAGIALVTVGFFAGHSVASGWVGPLAGAGKGQAAGLYLLAYYLGSSIVGALGGVVWSRYGWPGVAAMVGTLTALGMLATIRLALWQRRG
ncbi:MFS transporter [Salinisphaera orenii]|uniref:MFS transporter n=1 Tax=Salinisphaera orenii YIM 95161 TaxID=1051139 RepID=A0A423PE88_9GAMM|nr:MFS transporter [Salinisphaera halophila]ROO23898.1 MFS transporter [Salinisphaera halophila YIM 95161]